MKPAKLYVHVPFCHAQCSYCDFYSTPRREWMEAYVDAVVNEWESRKSSAPDGIDTIYLGGGTPSSLPDELLLRLVSALTPARASLREFTIEANPEDVTAEWVKFVTEKTSADRISMGIQSFVDSELRLISRRHSATEAAEAYKRLRDGGIGNISCDLIYGLPLQTLDSWKKSLDTLLTLRPEHISAYLLSYEDGTKLSAMRSTGKVTETEEQILTEMYRYLCEATRDAGYLHYEISNFALPGKEAVHNSSYWDGSTYIGLGPGAYSWDGTYRSYNPSDLKRYIACQGKNFSITEEETRDNRFNDTVMTALRTSRGLNLTELENEFGAETVSELRQELPSLISQGHLRLTSDDVLTIPEEHWLISNSILLPLIRV
ncbi:MAG: radical SAM family heme chaperone HemW [Duncaniella sp.]|nr:radical SAM family heme chaperone HemW [Duncaniella sp.]